MLEALEVGEGGSPVLVLPEEDRVLLGLLAQPLVVELGIFDWFFNCFLVELNCLGSRGNNGPEGGCAGRELFGSVKKRSERKTKLSKHEEKLKVAGGDGRCWFSEEMVLPL